MTICSDLDDGVNSVVTVEAGVTGAIGCNRTHSPIPEESEERGPEQGPETIVFVAPPEEREPELVREATLEENIDASNSHGVLQKHHSMSLSETISNNIHEELSQHLEHDDDASSAKWYNNKL